MITSHFSFRSGFSFNAWMEEIYEDLEENDQVQVAQVEDRYKLNLLKRNRHQLFAKFDELIHTQEIDGVRFRGNFGELHGALVYAQIPYRDCVNEIISLGSCPITREGFF